MAIVLCKFGSSYLVIKLNFCSDFDYKFGQDFEAEVWSVFCCWSLVEFTKLNLGQDSDARFGEDFKFKFSEVSEIEIWSRFV